ncbi:MAG TPA: TonB-dependent receptor [Gemmatimonadaceae bacterium]|nr:TonB-dependent receptor [Gemmatimonadaceae bacterium]
MPELLLGAARLWLALQVTQGGGVTGTVTDEESGVPIAGVTVLLTDLDRWSLSTEQGRYLLRGVPPGPQHLTIRRIGYASRTLHALVPPGGAVEINVALRRVPVRLREVEVRPRLVMRGVEDVERSSFPARAVTMAAARNHPLLSEPDAFLALTGGGVTMAPEAPTGVHIAGGASDQTAFLLDGIPVLSPYHAAGTFSAWNPDALDRMQASAIPSADAPDGLAGTVSATTRAPGGRYGMQGSVSNTQLRLTADGPLGRSGAGYLVSLRSGFPGAIAPPDESSYLRGGTADVLAKVRVPAVLGGHTELLLYDADNEFGASVVPEGVEPVAGALPRHLVKWHSRSAGAGWERPLGSGGTTARVRAWRAEADAMAGWTAHDGARLRLGADRHDIGVLGLVEHVSSGVTTAGAWVRRSTTAYRVMRELDGSSAMGSTGRNDLVVAFARHEFALRRDVLVGAGVALAGGTGRQRVAPQARITWEPLTNLVLTGAWARSLQHAQSMRNGESLAGAIFPADLSVGAGPSGLPVARSDLAMLAAAYRPRAGVMVQVHAYERRSRDLALVPPATGEPFATEGWITGDGSARGIAVEGAVSGTRFGVLASYAWQRVRFTFGDSRYVPGHGATHMADAGVIAFPSPTWSVRLGITAVGGRRATALAGSVEWEACNLLDRGCEFGGSPHYQPGALGRTRLPPYARVDLGIRKHWHVTLGGRDVVIAGFGTVTNVLGRMNALTTALDPTSGRPMMLEMRPLAPLVAGLDWRF